MVIISIYKKLSFLLLTYLVLFFFSLSFSKVVPKEAKVLRIYTWAGHISPEVIKKFQRETGIKVEQSYYENDEILESKLLTGSIGYDIVTPSCTPYFGRQVGMGVFRPLDRAQLPNWNKLDPHFLALVSVLDPKNQYGVPYSWGLTGFAYNKDTIHKYLPASFKRFDHLSLVFDLQNLKALAPGKVLLLDSSQDAFESALYSRGITPNYQDMEQLKIAETILREMRPSIKAFTSDPSRMTNDLLNGEAVVVQMWSGDAVRLQRIGKQAKKPVNIAFNVPKEYAGVWCDVMAIPKNAPHPRNAHLFLNFMMRGDVAAQNIAYILSPMANREAVHHLPADLKNNPFISPNPRDYGSFHLHEVLPLKFERKLTRLWTHIKVKSK